MIGHFARVSPYTVGAVLSPVVAVPAVRVGGVALAAITTDGVLAVIGSAGVIGTALAIGLIHAAPWLKKLVPVVLDLRKSLRDMRAELDDAKQEAKDGHRDNTAAITANSAQIDSLKELLLSKDHLIRTLAGDMARARLFDPPSVGIEDDANRAILVVDDDPATSNGLRRLLRNRGYKTVAAADAIEAIRLVGQGPVVVVLDLMLHGEAGGETVLAHIRENNLPIRFVVTTGIDDRGRMDRLNAMRPDAVIVKPVDYETLLAAIRGDMASALATGRSEL